MCAPVSLHIARLCDAVGCAQAPVPRVVALVLNGLDWQAWKHKQDVLSCLRDRFEAPVRVYGVSPHTTSGTQLRALASPCTAEKLLAWPFSRSAKCVGVHDVQAAGRLAKPARCIAPKFDQAASDAGRATCALHCASVCSVLR